jgi:hypothetical protein
MYLRFPDQVSEILGFQVNFLILRFSGQNTEILGFQANFLILFY